MNFLKKKINKEDGIFKFEINDNETKKLLVFIKKVLFQITSLMMTNLPF